MTKFEYVFLAGLALMLFSWELGFNHTNKAQAYQYDQDQAIVESVNKLQYQLKNIVNELQQIKQKMK